MWRNCFYLLDVNKVTGGQKKDQSSPSLCFPLIAIKSETQSWASISLKHKYPASFEKPGGSFNHTAVLKMFPESSKTRLISCMRKIFCLLHNKEELRRLQCNSNAWDSQTGASRKWKCSESKKFEVVKVGRQTAATTWSRPSPDLQTLTWTRERHVRRPALRLTPGIAASASWTVCEPFQGTDALYRWAVVFFFSNWRAY